MAKNKEDIRIIRKIRRIEFWYKDEFYVYEFRSENNTGYAFIWKGNNRIYGPLVNHSTEEGKEVYNAIHTKIANREI
jgi:hypothetical protein